MTALVLGQAPESLTVYLSPGARFHATLRSENAAGTSVPWPAGAELRLELSQPGWTRSWPFELSGPLAALTLSEADTAAVPEGPVYASLWLDYGSGEFLWCRGSVVRA